MSKPKIEHQAQNNSEKHKQYEDLDKNEYDQESKEAIRLVFQKFDKDGSGDIQFEEIGNLAKELGLKIKNEDIQQIFLDLDQNSDKKISFEEFWAWWSSGKPNKLEKLVYYKLKGMKLLKLAHTEFTRMGASLDSKYEKSIDSHYIALNYGSSKGDLSAHINLYIQHSKNQEVREQAFKGIKLKDDNYKSAFGIVMRMKSKQPKEGRKILLNLLIDAKRIIGLLNGPQMGKLIEPFEFETFDVDEEIVLFINFKKSTLESFIMHDLIKGIYQIGEKANAHLEIHLGIKNSLKKIMEEPNIKFVNWLFEGFLAEAKLTMDSQLLKNIRKLIITIFSLRNMNNPDGQSLVSFVSIMTLLSSSKFHLTFKDMDNIKTFFEGLGLTKLSEDAPSCFELFKELLQDVSLDKIIAENSTYPILKNLIQFLNDQVSGQNFNIFLCFDIAVLHAEFNFEGLGDIIQKLIYSSSTS
ncbi:hypothetical protein ABPG74_021389 [Tetrahymena malaccensis]